MSLARSVAAGVLGVVRRGREVAWTPEFMNVGNILTLGLWAYEGRRRGVDRAVLLHPRRDGVLRTFPGLAPVLVDRSAVRFTDRRTMPWAGPGGEPVPWEVRRAYARELLVPGSPAESAREDLSDTLVVNVRRGDYYSVPRHRAEFGFDVPAFVDVAVRQAVADGGVPGRIRVVSDDPAWCREHLAASLRRVAPVEDDPDRTPDRDLAVLVHAPRVILANSTFSYWAGFIGDAIHGTRAVYVPWLFSRAMDGGSSARQVRPEWTVVEDLPGGWGPPDPPAPADATG